MAGPLAKLYATLGLDAREFTKGVDTAQKKTQSFTQSFRSSAVAQAKAGLGLGVGIGAGAAAFGALTTGVGIAIDVLGDAVTAAMEEEAAIATLTQAIEANDRAWDGNIDAVRDVIDARQALAFADDEQYDSLQRLVSITGDVNKALELQRTAMDYARLTGKDLATATDTLGKVYAGSFTALRRAGIILDDNATSTDYLAEVQRRAAGAAQAYAETTQGRFLQAQIAMNNAMEELGTLILPVVAELAGMAAGALRELGTAIGEVQGHVERANVMFTDLSTEVTDAVGRDVVNDFSNFFRIVATGGLVLATDSLPAVQGAVQDTGEAMGLLTEDMAELGGQYDVLSSATTGAAGAIGRATGDIVAAYDPLSSIQVDAFDLAGPIEDSFADARKAIRAGFGSIKDALRDPPQLIGREERLGNMEARQRRINRQLHAAVEADDPFNIAYWAKAAAKQQAQLDAMSGRTRTAADQIKAAFGSMDMTAVGLAMMQGVAAGIRQGAPLVSGAAAAAASGARVAASASPAVQSNGITIHGNVYGGDAGLRQLSREQERANRPTGRERRHKQLAEG